MTGRITVIDGAVKRDTYLRFGQGDLVAGTLFDDAQQRCANAASPEIRMDIPICSEFRMFVLIEEFFIADDLSLSGLDEKGILFQFKFRSLPFMLQLIGGNGNDGIAIGGAGIIDELCYG